MRSSRLVLGVCSLGLWLVGCGDPANKPAPHAPSSQPNGGAASSKTGWEGKPAARLRSKRLQLDLPLPDGKTWQVKEEPSGWLKARHAPTKSALRLRVFYLDRPARPEVCLTQARRDGAEWLPRLDRASVLDESRGPGPKGFMGYEFAQTLPVGGSRKLIGQYVRAAVSLRRCVVAVFSTIAEGPSAAQTVADRLAAVQLAVMPALRVGKALGARGQRSKKP